MHTPMNVVLEEDKHWWFASRTRAILGYLDRYMGPGTNRRVLDVGCGAGNMAHHLAHYGQVTGVDLHSRPLEVAAPARPAGSGGQRRRPALRRRNL